MGSVLVGVLAIWAGLFAGARWRLSSLDRRWDKQMRLGMSESFSRDHKPQYDEIRQEFAEMRRQFAEFRGQIASLSDRLDALDVKTSVRLKALEEDMHLVKQHLLAGTRSA